MMHRAEALTRSASCSTSVHRTPTAATNRILGSSPSASRAKHVNGQPSAPSLRLRQRHDPPLRAVDELQQTHSLPAGRAAASRFVQHRVA